MDGMWSRFFPATARLRKWLAEGQIGRILGVEADFGVKFKAGPKHRIHNPDLGGGALLDLGIYPVSFVSMVYGKQSAEIASTVHFCSTGVDDQEVLAFQYDNGATAAISISSRAVFKQEARIFGTKGKIHWSPDGLHWRNVDDPKSRKIETPIFSAFYLPHDPLSGTPVTREEPDEIWGLETRQTKNSNPRDWSIVRGTVTFNPAVKGKSK